jgi:hypothetical protein
MHLGRQLGEGPTHYIERLKTAYPDLACELDELLNLYVVMTYQELDTRHTQVAQMKPLLKQIKARTTAQSQREMSGIVSPDAPDLTGFGV